MSRPGLICLCGPKGPSTNIMWTVDFYVGNYEYEYNIISATDPSSDGIAHNYLRC